MGKQFLDQIYGYEEIPIFNVDYDARCCKFERLVNGKIQWMLGIGYDVHTHIDPIPGTTRYAISTVVEDTGRSHGNARSLDVPK